uniref:Protein NAP1 n=1 Tax=Cajanus cajan TaxID=3821 RepID=A0A151SVV9_CAJCA|nr:Protein NAP1 [Cajanus cajan]
MGGLEGLINILDSEGGFGALENQLLPEQAASYLNQTSRVSIPSYKSPKGTAGFPLPGHESFPENNGSIKMLEAAMQRLTNLCSVLNDMEPICVLNHVFILREYMRECILGNFRRRLIGVLKTDNDLQRPTVLESLIKRHISIVHLAEQHISMDITQGIREVLLSEAFSGPVSSLHLFEKPTDQHTGSATESVCIWYIENIIKDVSVAGILFVPIHKCFRSTRPVGGYFAESVTDLRELQAFVRIFGGYGVDRLDRMLKEQTAALLNCIDTSLRSNRDVLEAVATSLHACDRIEREASVKQIVDLETVIGFCVQAGLALAFGTILEEGAPLIHSLLAGVVKHLPDGVPEKEEIKRMRTVANTAGVVTDHDSIWVRSILEEVGGASDGSWGLLPYLFATFMTSNIWSTTAFNVDTEGFSNNIHCLARSHLIAQLIFLDQLCEISPYLPRSSLETLVPYAILRSVYSQYYSNTQSAPLAILNASPRHSPAVLLAHASPVLSHPRGGSPQYYGHDPGYFKGSWSHSHEHLYDADIGSLRSMDNRQRNVRRSGPLDYSANRNKVKSVEGSTSGSTGPSPLPRFAVSRSGPLAYK